MPETISAGSSRSFDEGCSGLGVGRSEQHVTEHDGMRPGSERTRVFCFSGVGFGDQSGTLRHKPGIASEIGSSGFKGSELSVRPGSLFGC